MKSSTRWPPVTSELRHSWPRRGYADGPFGQIHFQELGSGRPIVLLHQAPMTSGQFDNVYEPLARRGFRAIGIDMPGFGQSDPTDFVPTVTDYAQVVPPVLDALGIRRAAILGHHTGALAATEAAITFPERIDALIVNGPLIVSPEEREHFFANLHVWERGFSARPEAGHMTELFSIRDRFAAGSVSPDRISDYVVQALSGRGPFWYGHHAAYTYQQDERLPLVSQRTLLLSNTGDMIAPHVERARAVRSDFHVTMLEGGGIDIVDQQPEAWADAVAAFLNGPGAATA